MIPRDAFDLNAVPLPAVDLEPAVARYVPYLQQLTNNWCWAACVQMVVAAHQAQFPTQCQLANTAFGRQDCCNAPTPAPCDQGFDDICQLLIQMQFNCREQAIPMTPVEIENQVRPGRPIIYNILWGAHGAQHTGVISNLRQNQGNYEVYFLDPDAAFFAAWGRHPHGWVAYDWVLNGYGFGGNWTTTWYDIEQ